MKYFNITRRILLVGVLTLTFGSCTDDFETPEPLTGKSIATIMEADANFTLWTAMTKRVGMYPSLSNPNSGVVTIFGPSDPALTSYLAATYSAQLTLPITEASLIAFIDGLSTTSNPTLASFVTTVVPVLNYHIVSSKLTASMLTGNQTFATLNGARLSISVVNSVVLLNGNSGANGATVTNFDLLGSNGVAHTADRVMTPIANATVLSNIGKSASTPTTGITVSYTTNPPTVAGATTVGTADNYELMGIAIRRAGIAPNLLPSSSPLPEFTIFSPTDAAWQTYLGIAVGTGTEAAAQTAINALDPVALAAILNYHIVSGRFLTADLTNGLVLTTLAGGTITVNVSGSVIAIADGNAGTDPTLTGSNSFLTNSGVVHTLNGVLLPN